MEFSRQEYWSGLPFPSLPLGIRETFINSPFIKLFSNYSNLNVPSVSSWALTNLLDEGIWVVPGEYNTGSSLHLDLVGDCCWAGWSYLWHEVVMKALSNETLGTVRKDRNDTFQSHSWTIRKAECRRIDAFKLWCGRRLFRVPWTARRSNQGILKEINPEYLLERLMLKLQYFGYLMRTADSLEKTLMLGKIEGKGEKDDRGWDGWMASLTQWTQTWEDSGK